MNIYENYARAGAQVVADRRIKDTPTWVRQNLMGGNLDAATRNWLAKADPATARALLGQAPAQVSAPGGGGSVFGSALNINTGAPGAAPGAPAPTNPADVAGGIMQKLYEMRPKFLQQQVDLLNTLGPSSRAAVMAASPELAQASSYYSQVFNDPFGGALENYQQLIRQAQSARGFEGGGAGLAGGEAKFLTSLAQQTRAQTVGAMQNLGTTMLGVAGLSQGPELGTVAGIGLQAGGLALQEQGANRDWWATLQSADYARRLFEQQYGGSPAPAGFSGLFKTGFYGV